jgi:hypothetical protein
MGGFTLSIFIFLFVIVVISPRNPRTCFGASSNQLPHPDLRLYDCTMHDAGVVVQLGNTNNQLILS